MSDFIIIEILFKHERTRVQIPVVRNRGLSLILHCLDKSEDILAYQVIDSAPVPPKYFGFGPDWSKWVMKWTDEMFDY